MIHRRVAPVLVTALSIVLSGACSADTNSRTGPDTGDATGSEESGARDVASRFPSLPTVHSDDLGSEWPLTVDSVEVQCHLGGGALPAYTVTTGGSTYALNAIATTVSEIEGRGWKRLDEILAEKVAPGTPVDMSALAEAAEATCR